MASSRPPRPPTTRPRLRLKLNYNFLLLARLEEPADRRCDRRTGRHNEGALGLLVLFEIDYSIGYTNKYFFIAFNSRIN